MIKAIVVFSIILIIICLIMIYICLVLISILKRISSLENKTNVTNDSVKFHTKYIKDLKDNVESIYVWFLKYQWTPEFIELMEEKEEL